MVEALFATYTHDSDEKEGLELNVFRFADPRGASGQFKELHGAGATAWHRDSMAVVDNFGVELTYGRFYVRVLFNDGPTNTMRAAAEEVARAVIDRIGSPK